jgi:excisionase family DNA binding protein
MEQAQSLSFYAERAERLLGVWEASDRLGVSIHTVRMWVRVGNIASHKVGARRLIPESEILRIIAQSYQPARKEMVFA